ncbi:R3H and G-patch domain protein [Aspergillus eucalypticola CBS 122712]|uniref:Protein SQS1 n=1 Tax=Aspergillus eucalypticola (strain CBS 122712 / IBT 29274) TaxID=1448314 RepID=A0A317V049_ASPEC|nr:R3H and G-patch domain protein [Aspergillus eucalypticola CBS 122712]PWY66162.1 R3H and G-patch domain protein [Aspergillus eucalypticola CBS 122712]
MTRSKAKVRNKKQKSVADDLQDLRKNHFTMQQEARNTEGRSLWRTGSSLRHQTVRFVSAQDIDRESETQPSPSSIEISAPEESLETRTTQNCDQATATFLSEPRPGTEDSPLCVELLDEFESTAISDSMKHISKKSHDDSSEDEVVFRGRRHQYGEGRSHPSDIRTQKVIAGSQQPRASEHSKLDFLSSNSEPKSLLAPKPPQTETCPQEMDDSPNYFSLTSDKRRRKKWKRDDDDILADYIDNIDTEYLIPGILGSSPHFIEAREPDNADKVVPTSATGLNSAAEKNLQQSEASAQRHNPTLSDEQECSENEVSEYHCNHLDEEISQEVSGNRISHTDSASTSSSDGSDTEDIEDDKSENLHADGNSFFASATAFADALDFDPYYGFDIMDFNRPSVKKKSKGKGRSLDISLSDSELESELVNAWQNDRAKKKARKQKREELRSQGLLGRGRQNPSLKDKYSNGIGTEDLRSEIRHFLLSPRNSLALPPMSKQHRKLVHELANVLSMKSQSRGKGSSRFPIVNKTSRTPAYSSKTISQMDRILSNGRGQRGLKSRDSKPSKPSKSRRGRTDATVSYMDGDVVGGSAPEIGAENKGRAMLEKMGWSIGTPLGSMNNKGILQPVAHIVKNSRAGLG